MASVPEGDPAVIVRGVSRWIGARRILAGVDGEIRAGEICLLCGPNGAGKTTLLRILAGLVRPTTGEVRLWGEDLRTAAGAVRGRIGLLAHGHQLYEELTAEENLHLALTLWGRRGSELSAGGLQAEVEAALEKVGLAGHRRVRVRALSSGMQRRLSLAKVLLQHPSLLLLDEPYTSLDQEGRKILEGILGTLCQAGAAALLVTHDISLGFTLAHRYMILSRGELVYTGRRGEVTAEEFRSIYALRSGDAG